MRKILCYLSFPASVFASWLSCNLFQSLTASLPRDTFIDTSHLTGAYLFHQVLFITALSLLGWAVVMAFQPSRGLALCLFFPVGYSLAYCASVLVFLFNIPYNAYTNLAATLILTGITVFFARKRRNKQPAEQRSSYSFAWLAVAGAVGVIIATLCCMIPFKSISYDSIYYYQINASIMARFGQMPYFYSPFALTVGQLLPVTCSWPYLYGFRQPFGIQFMLVLSMFMFTVYYACNRLALTKKNQILFTVLAVVLCLALQTVVIMNSVWLLSNTYTMVFLVLGIGIASTILRGQATAFPYLALTLCIICLCASRAEGLFYSVLLAGGLISQQIGGRQVILSILLPSFFFQALLYINVFVIHKDVADELWLVTPLRALATLGVSLAAIVYFLWLRDLRGRLWQFIRKNANVLMLLALAGAYAGTFLLLPAKNLVSLHATVINLLNFYDPWGTMAILLIVAFAAIVLYDHFHLTMPQTFVLAYAIFTMLLFAVRSELRIGMYDSGNRVFMQLVPTMALIIIDFFAEKNAPQLSPSTSLQKTAFTKEV